MSYTTQKEFFNVSFRNEEPKPPDRKRSDGALMTYDLCTDGRAWALDRQKRSHYILDVVHKARFRKAVMHPDGQYELTKDYLIHFDADELADYVLSLQAEVKRKNESVHTLEESGKALAEQLEAIQKQSDELSEIRQQSALLERERADFEQQLDDLGMMIVNLKGRAEQNEFLVKENQLLRQQLQWQKVESANRIRLVNAEAEASFNRLRAEDYEKLEAELILFKAQYEDLLQQKRELKEQLQHAFVQQSKLAELKRQLALEQSNREKVEDELERVLSLYDQRFQDEDRQTFAAIEELEVQRSELWLQSRAVSAVEDVRDSSAMVELEVESCRNCHQMETELQNVRRVQMEELQERDRQREELLNQIETLRKELDSVEHTFNEAELSKCREELRLKIENEIQAKAQIARLEQNLLLLKEKIADETRKTELLESAAESEPPESEGNELNRIQKMLEDGQAELARKVEQLELLNDQNAQLQAEVARHRDEVARLEEIQQKQSIDLEVSKAELLEIKEQMTPDACAELEEIKQLNDELQQEIARLQIKEPDATSGTPNDSPDSVPDQSELMRTIEMLRVELDSANEVAKEREDAIERLKVEVDAVRSTQQFVDSDLPELRDEDKPQEMSDDEREQLNVRIMELEEKLRLCEEKDSRRSRMEQTERHDSSMIPSDINESRESGKVEIFEEAMIGQSLLAVDTGLEAGRSEETIKSIVSEIPSASRKSLQIDEEERKRETKESEVQEHPSKKRSIASDARLKKQTSQLEQFGFLNDGITMMGSSDPDRIRTIAIKIIHHGIGVLVVAELEYLHCEISRAIIERYLVLGRNVKKMDEAMIECNQIIHSVKKMSNSEMKSLLISTTAHGSTSNPLLDCNNSAQLSSKSKPRPKSTSFRIPTNGQKATGRALIAEHKQCRSNPIVTPLVASNIQGRIQFDDVCRTRPWRSPRTPTETIVASTLRDGSRIVTHQKRYT